MNKELQLKLVKSLLLIVALMLAHIPWLDDVAESYTEQGIKRTLITYAVSRSMNGIISVAQGTEVAVSPAGVGLTFAPGEILDPVNDLVERFSWIVLASGTSLGIQRIFLEITSASAINWLLSAMVLFGLLLLWFYRPLDTEKKSWSIYFNKFLLVIILLRFTVPLIAIINEALYTGFLEPRYQQAQHQLEQASGQIKDISQLHQQDQVIEKQQSLIEKAEVWLSKTQRSFDVSRQIDSLKNSAEEISQQIINMIVVFIVQTIIFPLFFLWLILKLGRYLIQQITV